MRLGAVALLVVTLIGNVGQADTWVKARVGLDFETEDGRPGHRPARGAGAFQDVTGADAAPISYFPNLSAAGLAALQRSHLLPPAPLTPLDMVNGRALLAVGDWNGSNTALSPWPLVAGHFEYLKSRHGSWSFARRRLPCVSRPAVRSSAANLVAHTGAGQGFGLGPGRDLPGARRQRPITWRPSWCPVSGPSSSVPVELVVPRSGTRLPERQRRPEPSSS